MAAYVTVPGVTKGLCFQSICDFSFPLNLWWTGTFSLNILAGDNKTNMKLSLLVHNLYTIGNNNPQIIVVSNIFAGIWRRKSTVMKKAVSTPLASHCGLLYFWNCASVGPWISRNSVGGKLNAYSRKITFHSPTNRNSIPSEEWCLKKDIKNQAIVLIRCKLQMFYLRVCSLITWLLDFYLRWNTEQALGSHEQFPPFPTPVTQSFR